MKVVHIEPVDRQRRDAWILDRRGLEECLRQAVAQADRTGEQIALHMIELDGSVAPACGRVLACLSGLVRRSDGFASLGSGRYALVQRAIQSGDGVGLLARKLLAAVAGDDQKEKEQRTASVGIAIHAVGVEWVDLMVAADQALDQARGVGGDTFRVFRSSESDAREARVVLLERLERALERGEFFLTFQPQIDARAGRIRVFEALLRWRHPERGVVAPAAFLEAAERGGLIADIGSWVLEEACRHALRWNRGEGSGIPVAVNATAFELCRPGFAADVLATARRVGLSPDLLELEWTESSVVNDLPAFQEEIRVLRQHGVRLAVDDFTMGFASLRSLRKVTVDKLKIPRELLGAGAPDTTDRALIEAIVHVGHRLGLVVVAEGVETLEQVLAVREAGCDLLQGYLIGRPSTDVTLTRIFPGLEKLAQRQLGARG